MISQLYVWSLEDFLRAWYLLREPLVMQASHALGNHKGLAVIITIDSWYKPFPNG